MKIQTLPNWLTVLCLILAGIVFAPAQANALKSEPPEALAENTAPVPGLAETQSYDVPSELSVMVGGTIVKNTTWISSNVYVVTNNLGIATNVTLNIEPGTVISFTGNYTFTVGGTLLANGTQNHPIQFTSRPGQTWGRIYFNNQSLDAAADSNGNYQSGSLLRWTTIQRAALGIGCLNATPFLERVTLTGGGMNCAAGDTPLWIKDSDLNGGVQVRSGSGVDSVLGRWSTRTSMATPRHLLGVAVGPNGILYAIGGTMSGGYQSSVEGYNPLTNTWETRADLPLARCCLGVATASNGRIYAIGGTNILSRVEEYDPVANTWAIRTSLPTGRYMLGVAAAQNGRLYAIGGAYGDNKVEEYNPALDSWAARANLPTGRSGLSVATAMNGKIYAVGGDGGMTTLEEYDPLENTWTTRASLPTARRYLGIAAGQNGKIYAIGGDDGSTQLASVEEYNPETNTWTTRASMSTARSGVAAVTALDGTIYAIGGANIGGDLAVVEAYTLPTAQFGYNIQNTFIRSGDLTLPETSQVISTTVEGAVTAGSRDRKSVV